MFYFTTFPRETRHGTPSGQSPEAADNLSARIAELERELGEMREYARAVLEDRESANEELRSANEELQSTNEELQSVNEELETASEEVQSANEELRTLNEELHAANNQLAKLNEELTAKNNELLQLNAALDARETELRRTRDYALAVIDTVREPLVVLDPDFHVVSASPPFYDMFKTSAPRTLGQNFFELGERHWDIAELRDALHRTLVDGQDFQDFVVDREVPQLGRRTMVLSGRRIRSARAGLANILFAIDDITERAQAEVLSESLDQINLIMISTVHYDELLGRAMTEAAQALRCDEAVLVVLVDGQWITRFSAGASWTSPGAALPDDRASQFSALAVGQRAIVSTPAFGRRAGLSSENAGRHTVHVPLRSGEEVRGAFSLGRPGKGRFTDAELNFIDKLAPALSMALGNAELHENERRIAEVLQTSLLRPVAGVPGFEIGLAYRPAHVAERVGGDFYDLFELRDGRVAVVVGDVSGNGVRAASLTETVRATLRALASFDPSPSSILTGANEVLLTHPSSSGQFVTVLLAILDVARRKIVISSAGHPPLVACGETPRFLEPPHGPPLGAMSHVYHQAEFDLLAGETLVLYTDGLTEARRGPEFFGEGRLLEILSGRDCSDPQGMVEALVAAATQHAGGRLTDDLAVIAVHPACTRTGSR